MSFWELLIRLDHHLFELAYRGLRFDDEFWREQIDFFMLVTNTMGEFLIYPFVVLALWYTARRPRVFVSRALIISLAIGCAAGVTLVSKAAADRTRPATIFMEPREEAPGYALPFWHFHLPEEASEASYPSWLNESVGFRINFDEPRRELLRSKSFPSGHALFAFALAAALAAYFPLLRLPLYVTAAISSLSRVYGAHHFLFDIVAGAFLAVVFVPLVFWAVRYLVRWRASRAGPLPLWARWLAEGLPQPTRPAEAPRRWGQRIALWLAVISYPTLIVLFVMLEAPLAWTAGPVVVLVYVLGSRGIGAYLARRNRYPASHRATAARQAARAESALLAPGSALAPASVSEPSRIALNAPPPVVNR